MSSIVRHLKVMEDPIIIGAIGGSGTRVFKKLLEDAKYFMGSYANKNEDAVPLQTFFRQWSNEWLRVCKQQKTSIERSKIMEKMRDEFYHAIDDHLSAMSDVSLPWGFKVPRSILFLPFLHNVFPGMKFVHVVRNGLDMVYSRNWSVGIRGTLVLEKEEQKGLQYLQSIVYWSRVNEIANYYGKRYLKDHYTCVRFEDICAEPKRVSRLIFDSLGTSGEFRPDDAIAEIALPTTVGRWRMHPVQQIYEIMKVGRDGLKRFGYWNPLVWQEIERAMYGPPWKRWVFQHTSMKRLPAW